MDFLRSPPADFAMMGASINYTICLLPFIFIEKRKLRCGDGLGWIRSHNLLIYPLDVVSMTASFSQFLST